MTNTMPKTSKDVMIGGTNKCMFCMKQFESADFLRAHYKKRHPGEYLKEGLEN